MVHMEQDALMIKHLFDSFIHWLSYPYAVWTCTVESWKAMRLVHHRQIKMHKIVNTPQYKRERKIDRFIYDLENKKE